MSLEDYKQLLAPARENSGGNQIRAAWLLRIARYTLRFKMKKFNRIARYTLRFKMKKFNLR